MRTITFFFVATIFIILQIACSPVRSTTFTKAQKSKQVEFEAADNKSDGIRINRQDTTIIEMPPVKVTGMMSKPVPTTNIEAEFANNVKSFEDKKYTEACRQFIQYSETLKPNDSLYFESLFYISECHVVKNEFQQAERVLLGLYNSGFTPEPIFEKTLIRLGHVNCILNKEQKAKLFFRELADRFPSSIYLPLADCELVKGRN